MNQGIWPYIPYTATQKSGQRLVADGFPVSLTVDGLRLNDPFPNPALPWTQTDQAVATFQDRIQLQDENVKSTGNFLMAPWFM